MKLRRETSLGIGAILALQILLSMLAIALLTRMGPAVEQILQENVYSEEAVEEMLATLVTSEGPEAPQAFGDALKRAKENVTEDAERPLLVTIDQFHEPAFRGDEVARARVVDALRKLGRVNRDSMIAADESAQRLGQGGAWAAAVMGALALALGVFVYRRLRLRLELPIDELSKTTQRIRQGNSNARCVTTDGPHEIQQIAEDLNWMLDKLLYEQVNPIPDTSGTDDADVRRALGWLLDQLEGPALILGTDGKKVASNLEGLDLELPDGESPHWDSTAIGGTQLKLYRRKIAE